MKNYVISLLDATQRRNHIIQEFSQQNIEFEFFDAIVPSQVNELANKFQINIKNANLTQGELACLISHISLWQKAIDENLDYICIFEDDIYLGENAHVWLSNQEWIPKRAQLIKLEMFYDTLFLGKPIFSHHHRKIHQLKQENLGTAGYIIHQKIASQLIIFIRTMFQNTTKPIDHIMFGDFLRYHSDIYQINPALCIQTDRVNPTFLTSNLEGERKQKRVEIEKTKTKLSFSQKIIRELKRVFHQLYSLIFATRLYFK
ncbi:glycosyltransferase family 25 protein [Moraxella oblonga]|uniref:glycosyltransferase family 25 protein n=1 Tax=Moraxella oblonga TaxID=200413 RepID=UPI000829DDFE|nr:glycosyltransferase family 25 protein [Moraxella oblonga]